MECTCSRLYFLDAFFPLSGDPDRATYSFLLDRIELRYPCINVFDTTFACI